MIGWLKLLLNIKDWDWVLMLVFCVIFVDFCWDELIVFVGFVIVMDGVIIMGVVEGWGEWEVIIWFFIGGCVICFVVVLLFVCFVFLGFCCFWFLCWFFVVDKFVFFVLGILFGIIRNN